MVNHEIISAFLLHVIVILLKRNIWNPKVLTGDPMSTMMSFRKLKRWIQMNTTDLNLV